MDIQEFAHGILKAQPFSQYVGAELTSTGEKDAEISLDITE